MELFEQLVAVSPLLLCVIISALIFDFVNGWNDSANAIATIVSTHVLTPLQALILAAVLNMAGALAGTEVAKTITSGIVNTDPALLPPDSVVTLLLAAMLSAITWAAWMTKMGMPISGSHSLIGGLVGGALAAGGTGVLVSKGVFKVLLAMLVSPIFGLIGSFLLMMALFWICRKWRPSTVTRVFSPLQVLSCSLMAFNHGLNDAQKVMGIITMGLVAAKLQFPDADGHIHPQLWVKVACGVMIALGTAIGGWKVIRTLGVSLARLAPIGGFAAETGASVVLSATAVLGVPVSTTHTITGAIMGVGATRGIRAVRWMVGQKILAAWVLTLPATIVLSACLFKVLSFLQ